MSGLISTIYLNIKIENGKGNNSKKIKQKKNKKNKQNSSSNFFMNLILNKIDTTILQL